MLKRITQSEAFLTFVGRMIGRYMMFTARTTRWTYVGKDIAEAVWAKGGPAIAAVWHSRLMLARHGWQMENGAQTIHPLISYSKDGDVLSIACDAVDAPPIRGSTNNSAKGDKNKGGAAAMRDMLRALKAGDAIYITPDGPRGPRMRMEAGLIALARHTGAPIICVAWGVKSRLMLKTWDRFVVPLPFSRGVYIWSGPFAIAKDASPAEEEKLRITLEAELTRITHEADRATGWAITEPADPKPHIARVETATADARP
jgi:hypothetical protein